MKEIVIMIEESEFELYNGSFVRLTTSKPETYIGRLHNKDKHWVEIKTTSGILIHIDKKDVQKII